MARKEIVIEIQDRDQPLTFKIKQMPATKLESWVMRAILLIAGSGVGIPEGADIREAGAYLAKNSASILPALGRIDYDKAKPLLDELLACCYRKIDNHDQQCLPENVDDFIQDVGTLFKLRVEAIKLNLGFLKPETEGFSGSPNGLNTEMP